MHVDIRAAIEEEVEWFGMVIPRKKLGGMNPAESQNGSQGQRTGYPQAITEETYAFHFELLS
jgi:hypothetical protein